MTGNRDCRGGIHIIITRPCTRHASLLVGQKKNWLPTIHPSISPADTPATVSSSRGFFARSFCCCCCCPKYISLDFSELGLTAVCEPIHLGGGDSRRMANTRRHAGSNPESQCSNHCATVRPYRMVDRILEAGRSSLEHRRLSFIFSSPSPGFDI